MKKIDYATEGQTLRFREIMFEITRRCNLQCAHCFRGDAQNMDISEEIIDKTLDQISCSMFAITGGEPFMAPDKLEYLVDGIIKRRMLFSGFQLVVNGTIMDERAVKSLAAINKLATYLYENVYPEIWNKAGKEFDFEKDAKDYKPLIRVSVSVDDFHHNNPDEAISYYKSLVNNKYVDFERQDEWTRTDDDGNTKTQAEIRNDKVKAHETWVDNEGRAKDNHLGYRINTCDFCNVACHKVEFAENSRIKCTIQICANGNVGYGEQLSFESEDKFTMGNILEEPLSCIIWKNTFNQPLQCIEVTRLLQCETRLAHGEVEDEEEKGYTKILISAIKMKRELMRSAHEKFPNLTWGELLEACDADLNIQTDGWYAHTMSLAFDSYREKYKDWTYDRDKEQKICNKYIGENALREFTESIRKIFNGDLKNE